MGILQNIVKQLATPVIKDTIAELQKGDSTPKVNDVPNILQVGFPYSGSSRRKYGSSVDFNSLRSFSTVYDVARICINHRKRQIENLEWDIVPKDDEQNPDAFRNRINEVEAFFEEPYPNVDFRMWIDRFLEDLLVLDAAVLWKDKAYGGKLLGLLPVDGTTIRLKVSEDGTTPIPPEIAYQQIIRGELHEEYTSEQMYYKMMNPRNNTPYGLSPLESLVIGVDAALRSQLYNASLLSEGTVPEGFFGVPEEWTPDQIKDYQLYFDTMLAGNPKQQSRIKFMPGGKGNGYIPTKKPEEMKFIEFEKWLLKKCCAMFDVQPRDIGFEDNAQPGNAESQQQMGNQRGLVPTAKFLKEFFTKVIAVDFGYTDLKFEWRGLQAIDDKFELERNKTMLEHGALTINEMRISQGLEPYKEEFANVPMIYTGIGPTPLDDFEPSNESTAPGAVDNEADEEIEEMFKWERKVLKSFKKGEKLPNFSANHIDQSAVTLIKGRLALAKSKEDVRAVFKPFREEAQERALIKDAISVSDRISKHKRSRYERIGQSTTESK